jgi:2-polyprenyl-3-methyl-5-hydroxy-6-metoxy-1,4-benzoquinol methylase
MAPALIGAAALEERIALMAPSRRLRMSLAERAIERFAGGRPISVLDAGCGDGLITLALAKRHPDWSLVGMDLSDELLEGGRERARNRGLANASFRQADLTGTLPEEGFDAVMAIECLSEIPDDRAALAAIVAALRPGGLFVVQVPDREWKPVLGGSSPVWRHEVRHGYSAAELSEMLSAAGVGEIDVSPTYRTTAAAAQEVRDRIKDHSLALRAAAFPAMVAAARLERMGITGGPANAHFAVARQPLASHAHGVAF